MAKPTCNTLTPTTLTSHGARFGGKCLSTGGLPTRMRWIYLRWPSLGLKYTPWTNDVSADQSYYHYCWDCSYISNNFVFCQVQNDDGVGNGSTLMFWCPSPKQRLLGAPWLIQTMSGSFTDTHYDFACTTDIACNLQVLVGDSKPWISPTTHVTHGVTFHHDAELYFHWTVKVQQNEEGDVLVHTFHIPCPLDNVTYWLIARGSVDGVKSPSIGPPFSFLRVPVPEMATLDATDITDTSAIIHGRLVDDQHKPAYVRLRYTKIDPYTDYTPIVGPYSSPKDFQAQIDSLDPDTQYKVGSMGSHDQSMERYGWGYPKYFKTLSGELFLKCHSSDSFSHNFTHNSGGHMSWAFKPDVGYTMTKAICRKAKWNGGPPPAWFFWLLFEVDGEQKPTGPPLFEFQLDSPTLPDEEWVYYERTFEGIPLIAGKNYAFVHAIPKFGGSWGQWKLVSSLWYPNGCRPDDPCIYTSYPPDYPWQWPISARSHWYETYSPTE